ncbi:iron chelate uptake ABC transporter family permease subunit [Halobacillus litoralis]|uniref:Iron chelate uptake ABC transporter family permease subunit n=1 Tax=Halobacillus litoralis TaxID=45668 RepID=A0A845DSL0_9BACI|nr:iron ABC transporter permease [Halobacillus litoralis]MYL20583.1 iron chelate uptake ABC transporter family permease subunit [Halobacillus litoralis]
MRVRKMLLVYGTSFLLLLVGAWFSLKIGAFSFTTEELVHFLREGGSTNEALVLYDVRLPRLIITVLVGANMAVAGALVQSLTQNPLASPSVLGINAGASFFVVAGILFVPSLTGLSLVGAGFLGGALAAGVIFLMSAVLQGGRMLVKIALVGVVIQSLFASGTQSLMLFNEESIHQILVWLTGTVAGSTWEDVKILLPLTALGLIAAVIMSKALSVMSLGEDVARGLGQRVRLQKFAVILLVVVLAGASVAFTGPIGFVGLIVPHIVRYLVGPSHALVLPAGALFGAALLVLADVGSRFISFPSETPVGIVTALIGAPYFIYLARKTQR